MYNAVLLDQWLILAKKTELHDREYENLVNKAERSKLIICTTMYREVSGHMFYATVVSVCVPFNNANTDQLYKRKCQFCFHKVYLLPFLVVSKIIFFVRFKGRNIVAAKRNAYKINSAVFLAFSSEVL